MAVPAAPTALVATPDKHTVSIAFTQATADPVVTNYGYKVDGGDATVLDPADDTSPVVIAGLSSNTEHSIVLYAINADGVSPDSAAVVTTTLVSLPDAPVLGTVTPGDNQLSIAFTQAAADPAVDGWQYQVDGKGGWKDAGITASPFVVTGLANDRSYSVKMKAVNVDGASVASNAATGTPTDSNAANDNGFDDATIWANPGMPVPHLDWNDPDD